MKRKRTTHHIEDFSEFAQEAVRIVEEGRKRNVVLRILGATAVRLHCSKFGHLFEEMARRPTDIDFMAYGKDRPLLKDFFKQVGYQPDERIITLHGYRRHIYRQEEKSITVDVFFDKLEFCHTIAFSGRLEIDSPTVTLADLLLTKMQIVKLNEKDVKDAIILFAEHDIGETNNEMIDAAYIARTLSDDWGFYYTFTTNMKKVAELVKGVASLNDEERAGVLARVNKVLGIVEAQPKSFKWKMRARVGTSSKWYTEVDESYDS